jgi:hypothetical protein
VDLDDFALFLNPGYAGAWTPWPARKARLGRSKSTIAAGKWTFIGFTREEMGLEGSPRVRFH